jgi:UrcA family protein
MKKLSTKMLLLAGLAGLAVAGAAAASPADSDAPNTAVVRYSADMLSTDSGARSLYSRIARAAESVCPNESYSLLVNQRVRECRGQAVAAAVSKIHNQRLAALHAASAKSG